MGKISNHNKLLCSIFLWCVFVISVKCSDNINFEKRIIFENVVVHFDFKGNTPKLSYLTSLLKDLNKYGANALLLEYEDMFPFDGELIKLRSNHAYSRENLANFLKKAVKEGFQLIPLVQTLGNFDYVLQHIDFKNLSEHKQSSESICPSKNESIHLLDSILRQVISFHRYIAPVNYFHIGSSEVYHINECDDCISRGLQTGQIFARHLENIYDIVRFHSGQHTNILIWDDMVRKQGECFPETFEVQPVYTRYFNEEDLKEDTLRDYQKNFGGVWIATAFKGVDGESPNFPNLLKRFINHYNVIKNVNDLILEETYNFQGIILSGFSRHRFMSPLCEPLTTSIPSLYLNLLLVQLFKNLYKTFKIIVRCNFVKFHQDISNYVLAELKRKLRCNIEDDIIDNRYYTKCKYPGSEINEILLDIEKFYSYSNGFQANLERVKLSRIMSKYYDHFVVNEYVNEKMRAETEK